MDNIYKMANKIARYFATCRVNPSYRLAKQDHAKCARDEGHFNIRENEIRKYHENSFWSSPGVVKHHIVYENQ